VVVVGGGITGCGVALDAAARGLRTALVEADDFAAGTSSRSSKLAHGGLRYLQHRELRLVYDALGERQRLLRNAAHLVKPIPFLIPLFGSDGVVSAGTAKAYSSALWLYDLTGGLRIGRRHRRIGAETARRHFPLLRADRLVAAFVYWDAQADDARLTLAVARTAASLGAVVVNHAEVNSLIRAPSGRLGGVRLSDGTEVRAEIVVNAGGVWSGEIADLDSSPPSAVAGTNADTSGGVEGSGVEGSGAEGHGVEGHGADAIRIRPAKGVHVTIPSLRLPCDQAVVLPVPGQHRSVFVVPWDATGAKPDGGRGRWTYVGTTDTAYEGPLRDPTCTGDDIDDLLAAVNAWTTADLTPADVSGSWAGLRPLLDDEPDAATADLSRRHRVMVAPSGLITVTGGKLTTYRQMASDATDEVLRRLGRPATPSPTRRLRLVGCPPARHRTVGHSTDRHPTGGDKGTYSHAKGGHSTGGTEGTHGPKVGRVRAGGQAISRWRAGRQRAGAVRGGVLGVPSVRDHLIGRYGDEAGVVAAWADADQDLAQALVPGIPYLRAEAIFAARHEMAGTLSDVLARRTRALILDRQATVAAAPAVARLIGGELGWSADRIAAETAAFVAVNEADDLAASQRSTPGDRVRP
jgi:glycerol-3-phosphate dehydrogenase